MKRILLVITFLSALTFTKLNAQIVNSDFENWKLDTFYLPAGTFANLPGDTTTFMDPVGWTSSNSLTGLDSIGGAILVTQSNNAYSGSSAIMMRSDTISIGHLTSLPISKLVIPGFVLNGNFPLGAVSISSGNGISPVSVAGAGQPMAKRLSTFSGYFNYSPVYNPGTSSNDTCILWATLRKGTKVIADAIFNYADSTHGYMAFSTDFRYVSCEIPDTLVILLASSIPSVPKFLTLPHGSVLLVDALSYDTLPGNYVFAPFAKNDAITAYQNTPVNINVLSNDTDCNGALTVSIVSGPHHGTAQVVSNQVVYTPSNNYLGLDTIFYKDTNLSNDTTGAIVYIFVSHQQSGIHDVNEIVVSLYPNPANNELNIQFENPGKTTARIYDMMGNLVVSLPLTKNNNALSVEAFASGLYSLQILNEQNAVLARSKFVVSK